MSSITELASQIGISSGYLTILLYHHNKYYKTYYIEKKKGKKKRQISSPNYEIKAIQSWILRNILEKIEVSDRATGFVPKKSIKDNAEFHQDQKFIMCLDIKDFFPSISKTVIYEHINKILNDNFLSNFISELCTFNDMLPQGGVTSPALSNIIFKCYDDEIKKLCNGLNINYSRYADDLTFSTNYFTRLKDVKSKVGEILLSGGFLLNDEKYRIMTGKHRKIVTGLYLNSNHPTVGRYRKKYVRSSLYNYYMKNDTNVNLNEIFGLISFISSIDTNYRKNIEAYVTRLTLKRRLKI